MDFYQDDLFKTLTSQLLKEPFAQEKDLKNKDLALACEVTQEAWESQNPKTESLENVRALICLLLSHLDLAGLTDFPKGKLVNFIKTETPSQRAVNAMLKIESALNEAKAELGFFNELVSDDKKAA